MKGKFKKLLAFLATGSMSVILAACYGVPIEDSHYKQISTFDNAGVPIPGLSVSEYNANGLVSTHTTSSNGYVALDGYVINQSYVKIEDTDGDANGGDFQTKEVQLLSEQDIYDVEMQLKNKKSNDVAF